MVILLTPELVALRLQAREAYPDAEWLPGDEPPVGVHVVPRDGGPTGTVLRGWAGRNPEFTYWWEVSLHERPNTIALYWPPALQRVAS